MKGIIRVDAYTHDSVILAPIAGDFPYRNVMFQHAAKKAGFELGKYYLIEVGKERYEKLYEVKTISEGITLTLRFKLSEPKFDKPILF